MSEKRAKSFVIKEILELTGEYVEDELMKFTFQALCKMKKTLVDKQRDSPEHDDEPFWSPWHCEYRDRE